MGDDLPDGLVLRHPTEDDHGRVLAVMDVWWDEFGGPAGSVQRALLLPRLFFQHFTDSSWLAEDGAGTLRAFLVGFLSPSRPDVAYVHFVGVDPALRRAGVAATLYGRFFDHAAARGASSAACITSPSNAASLAFHTRLGFTARDADALINGVPVQRDYDGPGLDRVVLSRPLTSTAPARGAVGGQRDLRRLIAGMRPELLPGVYVITSVPEGTASTPSRPFAIVREEEGLTLVLTQQEADQAGLRYDYLAACITLRVHSDLAAVGLTAAVSTALASAGISCNVIAGHHHDHLLVPRDRSLEALRLLERLARNSPGP